MYRCIWHIKAPSQCECISRAGGREGGGWGQQIMAPIFPPAKFSSGPLEVNTHCAAFEWIALVETLSEEFFANFIISQSLNASQLNWDALITKMKIFLRIISEYF